jgi:hypothetical protein
MVQIGFFMLRRPAPLNLYRVRSALSPLKFDCSRVRRDFGWKCNVGVSFGLESVLSDAEESSNNVAATSKLNGSWNLEPANDLEPDEVTTGGHSGA